MYMKKVFLIIVSVIMAAGGVFAQNIFFADKEGMVLLYANLDSKGKANSYTRQTIKKVEGSGSNMTITYEGQALDKNRRPVGSNPIIVPYTVTIANGVLEWAMKSYAAPGTESFISFEGDRLRLPSTLQPGDKLDDVKFILTLNMGIRIRTEIMLTEQECLAIEDVTVPAGTFKCHKVTQTNTAGTRRPIITKTITWYAPGIGSVKSETYNAKGKLQTATALQSIEN
jgi:hypothetical protein